MDKNIENNVNNGGVSMDFVESLIRSAMQRSGVPLRAPNSDETPDVPAPGDIPTSQQKVLFKGIKQVSLAQYESYTEEERKHYMFFVRETNEDNFGFIALGNLKYTIVPEDIRGLDVGYFPVCSGETPDTSCTPTTNYTTGTTPENMFVTLRPTSDGSIFIHRVGNRSHAQEIMYKFGASDPDWHYLPDEYGTFEIPVHAGDLVEFHASIPLNTDTDNHFSFSGTTCNFNVYGNVLSLCYGDDWEYGDGNSLYLKSLFKNCTGLTNASCLVLPGTHLDGYDYCYSEMFEGCTSLLYGPELPSEYVVDHAYERMFYGCTSLLETPELPATTVCERGYSSMFEECTGLRTAPEVLPSQRVNDYAYERMFAGCRSLETAPEIMLTGITEGACQEMFYSCRNLVNVPDLHVNAWIQENGCISMFAFCTSLVNAPNIPELSGRFCTNSCTNMFESCTSLVTGPTELSASDLDESCFGGMFTNCIRLVQAPDLPTESLDDGCYEYMFYGCASLTGVPELPATDLNYRCYSYMFAGCTSMVWAPDISAEYVEEESCKYMFSGCTSLVATPDLHFQRVGMSGCEGMFKDCTSLVTINEFPTNTADLDNFDELGYAEMFAGCTSLVNGLEDVEFISRDQGYVGMFSGCTSLTGVTGSLNEDGNWDTYKQMFKGCTSLVAVPSLNGDNFDPNCYEEMFMNCTSLVTAPELPSNYASSGCYKRMFYGCSSLNNIVCFLTDFNGYDDCTEDWVHGVAASGTFGRVSDGVDWPTGDSGIPNGWTVIDV